MKSSVIFNTAFFGVAVAFLGREPKGHEYQRLPWDSRSPCPGLNVMANHGYLPRSGENIDLAAVRSGVVGAFNFEATVFDGPFQQAVDFNLTTTGNRSTFNLADLALHDAIEFDGSLSRNDFYFGDDLHFDPFIWATVAKNLNLYSTGPAESDKYVTVELAAKARAARVQEAKRVNPKFNASAAEMEGSPGTTGLYLTTLWDQNSTCGAPKAWVKAFFEEERIPYREGYTSPKQRTGADLTTLVGEVLAVQV